MQESRNNAFLKGTVSLSLSVIVTKILGVAFKVPLSYVLGDSGMGYFNTAYAIYGLFYILCTAGVPKSLTLVISKCRSEDGNTLSDLAVLKSGLSLFAFIGVFSTLLNIICAPTLARIIGNSGATLSIIAVAPSIFFVSLGGVFRGYLNSTQRLTKIAISQLFEGMIKLVLGLALAMLGVRMNASVTAVSALAIVGITVGSAISFLYMMIVVFYYKTDDKIEQNEKYESKSIKKQILKNALPIALSATLLNLSSTLDLAIIIRRLVVSGVSEEYANSIYGNYTTLAVPMFNLVISVLAPIASSYMPGLAELDLKGKQKEFICKLKELLMLTLIVSVPASVALYFYSFDLLDVLFSLQSSAVGAPMLATLSLGICMMSVLTVVNTALESQRRISAAVFSLLLGAAVKLFVSYILIGRGDLGILGAPIGSVISYVVSLAVSLAFLERNGCRIFAASKILILYLVCLLAFYPSYRLIYLTSLLDSSFLSMLLSLAGSFLAYCFLLILVYAVTTRTSVFKMHKKQQFSLAE